MKSLLSVACCVALTSIPILAQTKTVAKAAMTDSQFVEMAGQTDMVEANLGKLAQNAAASQQVKDYGQMLDTDHTADYQQLRNAANQAYLTVPTAIAPDDYKAMIAPLAKLKGAAFDHKFAQEMVAGHTKAVEVYKKEAADAESAAIKSYAQTAIPVLEKHLSDAKDLEK